MYRQGLSFFPKPNLKQHNLPDYTYQQNTTKKFAFKFDANTYQQADSTFDTNDFNQSAFKQSNNRIGLDKTLRNQLFSGDMINVEQNTKNVSKFDPILPKVVFKRLVQSSKKPLIIQHQNPLIQRLKTQQISYPPQVQTLIKQCQTSLSQLEQSIDIEPLQIKQINKKVQQTKKIRKLPYLTVMGTDGDIFWAHGVERLLIWKYNSNNFQQSYQLFCNLNFQSEFKPISAVYATQVNSTILNNQRAILIAVAFYDQVKFYTFQIVKYQRDFCFQPKNGQKTQQILKKYVKDLMIKVKSKQVVQKLLIKKIKKNLCQQKPIIIIPNGGSSISILDLQTISINKSPSLSFLSSQSHNQIIKLLHFIDNLNPIIHYVIVLRKEIKKVRKENGFFQKIKNRIFSKINNEIQQDMLLDVYQWHQTNVTNKSWTDRIFSSSQIKKVQTINSQIIQSKLRQHYFDFIKVNPNLTLFIADISLTTKSQGNQLFAEQKISTQLKVILNNGLCLHISNLKSFSIQGNLKPLSHIQPLLSISYLAVQQYRKILSTESFLQPYERVKNKLSSYITQLIPNQKQQKYTLIDPVISSQNGLFLCQNKIFYQDAQQVCYQFSHYQRRFNIHQVNNTAWGKNKYMIFMQSNIQLVQIPNPAQTFLILAYLRNKYPNHRQKVIDYVRHMFQLNSQQKNVSIIQSILILLIQIQTMGKTKYPTFEGNMVDQILSMLQKKKQPQFFSYQKEDNNQTADFQQKSQNLNIFGYYAYKLTVNQSDLKNFSDYLFGFDTKTQQNKFQTQKTQIFNNNINISINEEMIAFLYEILVYQGFKKIQQKPLRTKQYKDGINHTIDNYLKNIVKMPNQTNQIYLVNIFSRILDIKQSLLMCSLNKMLTTIIFPILDTPQPQFYNIRPIYLSIIPKLQHFKSLIQNLLIYLHPQSDQSQMFKETLLLCGTLDKAIPKVALILKAFDVLAELHYYNNHQIIKNTQKAITLRNILFQVGVKETFAQNLVKQLFTDHSLLLDQMQQALPQIQIKHWRYFQGWKNMNRHIIQPTYSTKIQQPIKLNLLQTLFKIQPQTTINAPFKITDDQTKGQAAFLKQQFQWMSKTLNSYSYQSFKKYFTSLSNYSQFINLLLHRISQLQTSFLQLINKPSINKEDFQSYRNPLTTQNQWIDPLLNENLLGRKRHGYKQPLVTKIQLKSFLNYEEQVYNHQKYQKISQNIDFLNHQLVQFAFQLIQNYISLVQQKLRQNEIQLKPKIAQINLFKTQFNTNKPGKNELVKIYQRQIKKMINILQSRGSEFLKNKINYKLFKNQFTKKFIISKTNSYQKDQSVYPNLLDMIQNPQLFALHDEINLSTTSQLQKIVEDKERMFRQRLQQKGIKINQQRNWMHQYIN